MFISKIGQNYVSDYSYNKPTKFHAKEEGATQPAFKPLSGTMQRLSMRTVNPYSVEARKPPHSDFALLK